MKWYVYLICFVLTVVGGICGLRLYKEYTATSYINGSIDISNKFSQESFNYSSTSLVFYDDLYDESENYIFENDLLKVENFDGLRKSYLVKLNDYVLAETTFSAGSIYSILYMDFYDIDGSLIFENSPALNISIVFLSNKTNLKIWTNGIEQSKFFEQYFADNGIRLQVIEIL